MNRMKVLLSPSPALPVGFLCQNSGLSASKLHSTLVGAALQMASIVTACHHCMRVTSGSWVACKALAMGPEGQVQSVAHLLSVPMLIAYPAGRCSIGRGRSRGCHTCHGFVCDSSIDPACSLVLLSRDAATLCHTCSHGHW